MTSFIWKPITYKVQWTEPGGLLATRWRMRKGQFKPSVVYRSSTFIRNAKNPNSSAVWRAAPVPSSFLLVHDLDLQLKNYCLDTWCFSNVCLKLSWRGFCLWNHSCQLLPQETFRWNPKNYWLENPRATSGISSCSFSWRKKSDQASTGQWPWKWIHQTWGKLRIKWTPAFENGKCRLFCRYGVSLCVYVYIYIFFTYHDVLHMQCRECTYIHIHIIVNIKYRI